MVRGGSYAAVPLVERFVLCAISGASTFAVSLVSAAQVYIVTKLCGSNFTSKALDLCNENLEKYKKCMKAAIFPTLEMLIFPTIFTFLHMYIALSGLYCVLGCMVMMSCTCIALRMSGVVSGCTSVKAPVYPGGYPFPTVSAGECGKNNLVHSTNVSYGASTSENSHRATAEHEYAGPMPWKKALAVAFLLVPFRVASLASLLILAATKLVLLPVALISDIVYAATGMWIVSTKSTTVINKRAFFKESSNVLSRIRGLAAAVFYDLAWVLSLGVYGAGKIIYASTDVPASSPEAENCSVRSDLSSCCKTRGVDAEKTLPSSVGKDSSSISGFVQDISCCKAAAIARPASAPSALLH